MKERLLNLIGTKFILSSYFAILLGVGFFIKYLSFQEFFSGMVLILSTFGVFRTAEYFTKRGAK